jgi:hypothetical protein
MLPGKKYITPSLDREFPSARIGNQNSPAQRSLSKGRIGVSFHADSPTRRHFKSAATSSCPSLKISASTWSVPPTGRLMANRALSSEGVMRRMTTVSGLLVM